MTIPKPDENTMNLFDPRNRWMESTWISPEDPAQVLVLTTRHSAGLRRYTTRIQPVRREEYPGGATIEIQVDPAARVLVHAAGVNRHSVPAMEQAHAAALRKLPALAATNDTVAGWFREHTAV